MKTRNLLIAAAAIVAAGTCFSQGAAAQKASYKNNATQKYILSQDSKEPLRSGAWGVLAVRMDGDTLANFNSRRKLTPASNTKLLATGLSLHYLGPDFRYETRLGYKGSIEAGVLKGDLYIIGSGDPTMCGADQISRGASAQFSLWKDILLKNGITRIEGRIIGDGRYFDGPQGNGEWESSDLGYDYGASGNGLCFYENVQELTATPGEAPGAPVKIEESYPETPWMDWRNTCVTGVAGSGDNLELYNTDLAAVSDMRGTLAVDCKVRTESCTNRFGAYTCAWSFSKWLCSNGILVKSEAADIDPWGNIRTDLRTMETDRMAAAVEDLTILGSTFSPSLEQIASETNHRSDNFYAESLLRTLGKTFGGSAEYSKCREVEYHLLDSLGVDIETGIRVWDGSGLSRHNFIAPAFFVRYLGAMTKSPAFVPFVTGLPQPGNGTLTYRMKSSTDSVRARVYMKTGSMSGVRCYSGYIIPEYKDGTASVQGEVDMTKVDASRIICFSILTNSNMSNVYPVMDTIVDLLANEK